MVHLEMRLEITMLEMKTAPGQWMAPQKMELVQHRTAPEIRLV